MIDVKTPPASQIAAIAIKRLLAEKKAVPWTGIRDSEVKKELEAAKQVRLANAVLILSVKEHREVLRFVRASPRPLKKTKNNVVRAIYLVGPHGTGTVTNTRNQKKLNFEYEAINLAPEMRDRAPIAPHDVMIEQVGPTYRVSAIDHETGKESLLWGKHDKLIRPISKPR